jgi:hypothetical protein
MNPEISRSVGHWAAKYGAVTGLFVVSLGWAFATDSSFFPFERWSMFSEPGRLGRAHIYYVLSARRADGQTFDLPPNDITDALSSRTFMLYRYTANNTSLKIDQPHPINVRLTTELGGIDRVPDGVHMRLLLRAWGRAYNELVATSHRGRLTLIRLQRYRWDGNTYGDHRQPLEYWEVEL